MKTMTIYITKIPTAKDIKREITIKMISKMNIRTKSITNKLDSIKKKTTRMTRSIVMSLNKISKVLNTKSINQITLIKKVIKMTKLNIKE